MGRGICSPSEAGVAGLFELAPSVGPRFFFGGDLFFDEVDPFLAVQDTGVHELGLGSECGQEED